MTYAKSDRQWLFQLIGRLPVDTVVVIGFVLGADLIILLIDQSSIRAIFGLPLLLFLPGYAILTVLFPRCSSPHSGQWGPQSSSSTRSIDSVERAALSFGISLALMPPIALGLWTMNDHGFGVTVLLGVLTSVILLGMIYGTHQRLQLPRRQRYRVPIGRWTDELLVGVVSGETTTTVLNIALAISIVLAAGGLGYVVLVPNQSAAYTGVSLLTHDASGGPSAANYSTDIEAGNETDMTLALENHERRPISYTVVVEIQRIRSGNQSQRTDTSELTRLRTTVPAGETDYVNHTISLTMTGENLRLRYLIYKGEAAAKPTASNAYRRLFLWVDVSNGSSTNYASEMKDEQGMKDRETNTALRSVID